MEERCRIKEFILELDSNSSSKFRDIRLHYKRATIDINKIVTAHEPQADLWKIKCIQLCSCSSKNESLSHPWAKSSFRAAQSVRHS